MKCSAVCMTVSTVITPHCPDGIDGHRTLGDKPGLAGKRDMGQEEDFRTGLCVCLLHMETGLLLSTVNRYTL